jgi:hydrogenase maturation protease
LDAGQVEPGGAIRMCVQLPAGRSFEPLSGEGGFCAGIARSWELIRGEVDVNCERLGDDLARIAVRVANDTPLDLPAGASREQVALHSMVSSHVILRVRNGQSGGRFVSATDPPEELRQVAAACQNTGCWPVLVGEPPGRQAMLASPIILEDYPRVAQQSVGDFFDATEIDELLSLRILTLTEEEKAEMRGADEKTRLLLERVEALGAEQLLRLHGTARLGWPEGEAG